MQRILGLPTCLVGLTAGFLFLAACGQNEGGRCQINSDCASGLECKDGSSGNGVCKVTGAVVTSDAALKDVAEDVAPPFTSEVGAEAAVTPEIDAENVATGAVDSGSLDSTALD